MATVYTCDRCKERLPRLMYSVEIVSTGGSGRTIHDLCAECWQDLRTFMESK